ncbi:heterogeneous nuclear ribonucleoprotein C isoform X1 [Triplophysa dalaica]|uniref:heterogeneous nuclear ribonucleoprotein C isoform X1 n=1 Tax=Triplophysa dalaica TaxID=1582913 RepID=UPI0024DF6DD3|nr:heterogeneous nuclear ribonucleoprotein C isoform X1 [Triplophysa dalaica]XP_056596417.1 heterogeneous nuclear ribonucleoprotein C isoform X1 [Triplophysa dalaica]
MIPFRGKHHNIQYESMTGVLRPSKQKPGVKRSRGEPYRVFDYQHVPISVTSIPCDFTPFQQPCSSPASTDLRRSREKPQSRHKSRNRAAQLRMEELLCIKKELTVIKSQIDGLLDNLERMDPERQESSGRGVAYSPLHGSVSSVDGSSGDTPPLKTDEETQSPQTADSSDEDRQHVNGYESHFLYM